MLDWHPKAIVKGPLGRPGLLESIEDDVNAVLGEGEGLASLSS
jgi:hypothetical protein